jgi:hypothetical protein
MEKLGPLSTAIHPKPDKSEQKLDYLGETQVFSPRIYAATGQSSGDVLLSPTPQIVRPRSPGTLLTFLRCGDERGRIDTFSEQSTASIYPLAAR